MLVQLWSQAGFKFLFFFIENECFDKPMQILMYAVENNDNSLPPHAPHPHPPFARPPSLPFPPPWSDWANLKWDSTDAENDAETYVNVTSCNLHVRSRNGSYKWFCALLFSACWIFAVLVSVFTTCSRAMCRCIVTAVHVMCVAA